MNKTFFNAQNFSFVALKGVKMSKETYLNIFKRIRTQNFH